MKPLIKLVQLGRMAYRPALAQQHKYVEMLSKRSGTEEANASGYLLAVEHDPVYTVGMRARKDYRNQADTLTSRTGAEYVETDRGGLITFHGPGQMVIYPILDLKRFITADPDAAKVGCKTKQGRVVGMRWYVHTLEQTVMDTLGDPAFGIPTHRSPHTGVWTSMNTLHGSSSTSLSNASDSCSTPHLDAQEKKICAMGVHSSNLVTSHGLALNCNIDLDWFGHIVPCGIPDRGVTSISKVLDEEITIQTVLPHFIRHFQDKFQCSVQVDDTELQWQVKSVK